MKSRCLKRVTAVLAVLTLAGAAHAQYVWLDERGVKQYSDMAPPAGVPKNRILKMPGIEMPAPRQPASATSAETGESPASDASASAKAKTAMTTAEQNVEYQKRRAERAEKEKKASEKAKLDADKAKYCERAREYSRSLASGERLTSIDKNGERYFLSDEQRAQESREIQRSLDQCA
jgi:hypothetical protein